MVIPLIPQKVHTMKHLAPLSALFSLCLALPAVAGTYVWTGAGDGSTWNDAANWDLDAVPGATDTASFTAGGTINLGTTAVSIGTISLNSSGTLVLGTKNSQIITPTYVSVSGGGTLQFAGVVQMDYDCTWDIAENSSNLVYSAKGAGNFTKNGPGVLRFTANASNRTGDTVINEGVVVFSGQRQLGYNFTVGDGVHDAIAYVAYGSQYNPNLFNSSVSDATILIRNHGVFDLETYGTAPNVLQQNIGPHLTVENGGELKMGYFQFVPPNPWELFLVVGGTITGYGAEGRGYLGLVGSLAEIPADATHPVFISARLGVHSVWVNGKGSFFPRFRVVDIPNVPVDLTLAAPIITTWDARGSIEKLGPGVMRLCGSATYGGSVANMGGYTYVREGTLLADNGPDGSATGWSMVQVYGGATIGGTGGVCAATNWVTYSQQNIDTNRLYLTVSGTAEAGVATVAPGSIDPETGAHVHGTLRVGTPEYPAPANLGNYSALVLGVGTEGAADKLEVTGTLHVTGSPAMLSVTVDDDAAPGVYTLVSASEGIDGAFSTVSFNGPGYLTFRETDIQLTVAPKRTVLFIR